jgi:hypothetical protein
VQSSPIVGFGVDDCLIRGLMRFVKMTSTKFIIEVVISKEGSPNYKCKRHLTQGRFNFFYILNLSIGKTVL